MKTIRNIAIVLALTATACASTPPCKDDWCCLNHPTMCCNPGQYCPIDRRGLYLILQPTR